MKCSDVVAQFLLRHVDTVFGVSGGASLHLMHSFKSAGLKLVCPQHECNAGFMADAYARVRGFGCAFATSGPGATNLLTAIASSYYDSVPVLFITGQVASFRINRSVRQYGFQFTPIIEMVKPITKYAVMVTNPLKVEEELNRAWYAATSGRKGSVLVDICDDTQRASI